MCKSIAENSILLSLNAGVRKSWGGGGAAAMESMDQGQNSYELLLRKSIKNQYL